MKVVAMLLLFACASCGDDPSGPASGSDAGESPADAGASSLPTSCGLECRTISVTVDFGSGAAGFDHASYGLTSPFASDSGQWELHIEATSGGSGQCPTQGSPTPARTLVVSSVLVPEDTSAQTDGVAVSLLDFEGTLLPDNPVARATSVSVTPVAANICTDCVGNPSPSHPEGFVAVDLEAYFDEGNATGHIYATHCDSMDLLAL